MEEKTKTNESTEKKTSIEITIIKFQLLWYLINLLVLSFEKSFAFNLPFLDNIYLITFKVIGQSLFISVLLYWTTMVKELSFKELGITFSNFFSNLKLGLIISWPLLVGIIIIHLKLNNLKAIITITNLEQLSLSLVYFTIIFVCWLIPSLATELFFRGFIFKQLSLKYSYLLATIIGLSYYTLTYLDFRPQILIIHFIIGFITTYLYYKTDSLLSSIIFQTTYRASLTTFLFSFTNWPF